MNSPDDQPSQLKTILLPLFIGIIFCLIGIIWLLCIQKFSPESFSYILLSVGSSIIATAIVPLLINKIVNRYINIYKLHEKFGISNIYITRANMNTESNDAIRHASLQMDICAFGLTGLRSALSDVITCKVKAGIKIRVLAPSPESNFLNQRDLEEGHIEGQLADNIKNMCHWVEELKKLAPDPNNIQIKLYTALPLSSYMRVDDYIFIGPNMFGKLSQQTISFSFQKGDVFSYYTQYFESIWNDIKFCSPPD